MHRDRSRGRRNHEIGFAVERARAPLLAQPSHLREDREVITERLTKLAEEPPLGIAIDGGGPSFREHITAMVIAVLRLGTGRDPLSSREHSHGETDWVHGSSTVVGPCQFTLAKSIACSAANRCLGCEASKKRTLGVLNGTTVAPGAWTVRDFATLSTYGSLFSRGKCWKIRSDEPSSHAALTSLQYTYFFESFEPYGLERISSPLSGSKKSRSTLDKAARALANHASLEVGASGTSSEKKLALGITPLSSAMETWRSLPDPTVDFRLSNRAGSCPRQRRGSDR